jgi:hypothetical protein
MMAIVKGLPWHTVANVITKAALFEHWAISESRAIIFFTRATTSVSITKYIFEGRSNEGVELVP